MATLITDNAKARSNQDDYTHVKNYLFRGMSLNRPVKETPSKIASQALGNLCLVC